LETARRESEKKLVSSRLIQQASAAHLAPFKGPRVSFGLNVTREFVSPQPAKTVSLFKKKLSSTYAKGRFTSELHHPK